MYLCALDVSKAFDSVSHSQFLYSSSKFRVNSSVIFVYLHFRYANFRVRFRSGNTYFDIIPIHFGIRNASSYPVLTNIFPSFFTYLTNLSYIAYAVRFPA